jgi:hypothetical protein
MDGNLTPQKGPGSPAGAAKPLKIRAALSRALDVIAIEGQTQREAARRAGMSEWALSKALAKPHVSAELEQRRAQAAMGIEAIKGVAKASAYRVGLDLMHNSPDDKVRARMVELFAGETKQALVNVHVSAPQEPATGYRYRRPDQPATDRTSDAEDAQVIDGQAQSTDVGE